MAVIRIVDLPENSESLIDELRARGFVVYTGAEHPSEPADLELSVEECSVGEALEKCAQSESQPATIFIAPGSVEDAWRPIVAVPLIASSGDGQTAAPKTPAPESHQPEPALAILASPPEIPAVLSEKGIEDHLVGAESQLQQMPAEVARELPQAQASSTQDSEPIAVEPTVETISIDHSAGVLQNSLLSVMPAPLAQEFSEQNEEDQPSDWPIWNPLSEPVFAVEAASDGQEKAVAGSTSEIRKRAGLWPGVQFDEKLMWKAAPVAAALALITLFAITWAHRVSPLPRSISQGEEQSQQLPLTSPREDQDAHLKKVSAESALVPDTLAARPVPRPDSSSASRVVVTTSKRQRMARAAGVKNENDYVARDTVVRFPAKTGVAGPARKPPESSGVRRYSDLPKAPR